MAQQQQERTIHDMIYVGINKRVAALDRYTGEIVWTWAAPKGSGYLSLLLDGDRLIVSCNGYIFCLDPLFGQLAWSNPLTGYGTGIASLASYNGASSTGGAAATIAAQQAAAAAATVAVVPM